MKREYKKELEAVRKWMNEYKSIEGKLVWEEVRDSALNPQVKTNALDNSYFRHNSARVVTEARELISEILGFNQQRYMTAGKYSIVYVPYQNVASITIYNEGDVHFDIINDSEGLASLKSDSLLAEAYRFVLGDDVWFGEFPTK